LLVAHTILSARHDRELTAAGLIMGGDIKLRCYVRLGNPSRNLNADRSMKDLPGHARKRPGALDQVSGESLKGERKSE